VQVAGGALGARGTVTYQTGFAARLNDVLASVLGTGGAVAARTDGLQKDIKQIADRREALNARLAKVQAQYYAQFNALDVLLANLSAQSTALQQQLASLPKLNNNNN
jgi:flagellar hook-associated protein 2